ncbi:hypothetical protein IKE71_03585 [Candidatus Saccharibacteria bacterium]|nr:hypothetical protein [Candidatus Saccharibacteria bacterium]
MIRLLSHCFKNPEAPEPVNPSVPEAVSSSELIDSIEPTPATTNGRTPSTLAGFERMDASFSDVAYGYTICQNRCVVTDRLIKFVGDGYAFPAILFFQSNYLYCRREDHRTNANVLFSNVSCSGGYVLKNLPPRCYSDMWFGVFNERKDGVSQFSFIDDEFVFYPTHLLLEIRLRTHCSDCKGDFRKVADALRAQASSFEHVKILEPPKRVYSEKIFLVLDVGTTLSFPENGEGPIVESFQDDDQTAPIGSSARVWWKGLLRTILTREYDSREHDVSCSFANYVKIAPEELLTNDPVLDRNPFIWDRRLAWRERIRAQSEFFKHLCQSPAYRDDLTADNPFENLLDSPNAKNIYFDDFSLLLREPNGKTRLNLLFDENLDFLDRELKAIFSDERIDVNTRLREINDRLAVALSDLREAFGASARLVLKRGENEDGTTVHWVALSLVPTDDAAKFKPLELIFGRGDGTPIILRSSPSASYLPLTYEEVSHLDLQATVARVVKDVTEEISAVRSEALNLLALFH